MVKLGGAQSIHQCSETIVITRERRMLYRGAFNRWMDGMDGSPGGVKYRAPTVLITKTSKQKMGKCSKLLSGSGRRSKTSKNPDIAKISLTPLLCEANKHLNSTKTQTNK